MAELTQWAGGTPPCPGWWDTKCKRFLFGTDYEIRLWWTGGDWRASPNSPSNGGINQIRQWRGLAEKQEAA